MADEQGRPTPGRSLPGIGREAQPLPPTTEADTAQYAEDRRLRAEWAEARTALRVANVAAVLAITLLFVGALPLGVAEVFEGNERRGPGPWAASLVTLVLLLVALQFVALLLALEHRATDGRGLWLVRVTRALVVLSALLAIAVGWVAPGLWEEPGWLALVALLLALVWQGVARREWKDHPIEDPAAPIRFRGAGGVSSSTEAAPHAVVGSPDEGVAAGPPVDADLRPLRAIGASGGGIRASAFVLGGYQALQAAAVPLKVDSEAEEPHVFAVSGGSYMAAALALRRTYDAHGDRRAEASSWRTSYAMESPELERLRRHTRYLYEPSAKTRDGLLSLVIGAVLNLFILAVVLRAVTWLSSQVAVTIGFVDTDPFSCGPLAGLNLACGWGPLPWLYWSLPVLLALGGVVALTFVGWRATRHFDADAQGGIGSHDERLRAISRMETSAQWRPILLLLAVAWAVLSIGLPAAATGLAHLAATNQPTTIGARLLHSAGFATSDMCQDSFEKRVAAAVKQANSQARVSPGNKREVTTGACGVETTVTRTVETQGDADPRNDVIIGNNYSAARDVFLGEQVTGPAVGVGALLAVVLALLRKGPAPEANAAAKRWSRVKRGLLTWLPLLIAGLLAAYAVLIWTFGFMVNMGTGYRGWTAAITLAGCALAFYIDANATSMHGFYRSRLADAFAVTVDGERATQLPPEHVYRFSDMAATPRHGTSVPGPRLHIVTTMNSQAPNEAPTMRGGFPMVFGPQTVNLYREERTRVNVPTRDYENHAGPGRVSVMAAVAISGAAISPLMGRFGVQMAPYRLLLALFNLRVGAWVTNPLYTPPNATGTEKSDWDWLWMTRKPGLANVALEGVGRSSANSRWIYLSDGGHLDNTGLVECVRHCVVHDLKGRILVLDASNDPVGSWSAVGDAIAVIRADLNIDLRRAEVADPLPWMRRYSGADLDVVVVKAVPTSEEDASGCWSKLPPNVQSFQRVHADFPRSSTTRQKFGDLEFEAYRGLGYAATESSLAAAGWT